jgi:hypothetical protein
MAPNMNAVATARENASFRREFLRRGLATEDQLDRIGWVSSDDLDLWEEAGVLELGVQGLQESSWAEILHPRGRGGKWVEKLDKQIKPGEATNRRVARIKGPRVERVERRGGGVDKPIATVTTRRGLLRRPKQTQVFATPKAPGERMRVEGEGLPERMGVAQFRQEVTPRAKMQQAGHDRLARLASAERRADRAGQRPKEGEKADKSREKAEAAVAKGDHLTAAQHYTDAGEHAKAAEHYEASQVHPPSLRRAGQAELYQRRTKGLEKRIKRKVGKAGKEKETPAAAKPSGPQDLTTAETHFNDAGRVSQKTLLSYVEEAATQPTTAQMYRNANGEYHPSRKALHAAIIDMMFRQHGTDERGKDIGLSSTTPRLEKPSGKPTVLFTGGGYAAGKGSLLGQMAAQDQLPKDAVVIDPDLIKAWLPEFQQSLGEDPEANLRVYTEAWDIAQQAMAMAQKKGMNVIVDGITNTSPDEVAARVKTFTDAGYVNPRISYVSVPTEEALKRAHHRLATATKDADKRYIPDVIMRSVHRDVSAAIPGVMARAKDMGVHVQVYDTNQGKDEFGHFNPPKLLAEALPDGHTHYPDRDGYQQVLNKATETIPDVPDVQAPERGAWKTGGQITSIDKGVERNVGRDLAAVTPSAPEVHSGQPTGDVGELTKLANQKGLPAFKALLDLGAGVAAALGADVHDISSGKSFEDTGKDIAANMDKSHVIIAPVKDQKRALAKVAGLGHAGDARELHDMVRATVTVPSAHDLPTAMAKIKEQMAQGGWTVEHVKPRLADATGSKRFESNGYGDMSLILRGPKESGGMLAELQLNTNPMWWTKEVGPGHDLFDLERQVTGRAAAEKRKPTNDESKLAGDIQSTARPLYDRAWGASLHGGIHGQPDAVLGNEAERSSTVAKIKELGRKTAGLASGMPTTAPRRLGAAA